MLCMPIRQCERINVCASLSCFVVSQYHVSTMVHVLWIRSPIPNSFRDRFITLNWDLAIFIHPIFPWFLPRRFEELVRHISGAVGRQPLESQRIECAAPRKSFCGRIATTMLATWSRFLHLRWYSHGEKGDSARQDADYYDEKTDSECRPTCCFCVGGNHFMVRDLTVEIILWRTHRRVLDALVTKWQERERIPVYIPLEFAID